LLILVFFADDNRDFCIIAKGNVPHQFSLVFYVVTITMSAKIIIHTVQKTYIIRLIPVVDLLAYIQILIPWK